MCPRPESSTRRPTPLRPPIFPDRREHRLLVNELLEVPQGRAPPLGVHLRRLFPEESVDVVIAAVDIGAARGHEGLNARGRIAEGAAGALDEVLELLLGVPLKKAARSRGRSFAWMPAALR